MIIALAYSLKNYKLIEKKYTKKDINDEKKTIIAILMINQITKI